MTIEQLPRYERLPGEYFVYQIGSDPAEAARFLSQYGTAFVDERDVRLSPNQHRETSLRYGDYVTFRVLDSGEWSVISYRKADFESRYQRVTPPCT